MNQYSENESITSNSDQDSCTGSFGEESDYSRSPRSNRIRNRSSKESDEDARAKKNEEAIQKEHQQEMTMVTNISKQNY